MSHQCRARMIDGTPVTFEHIDLGNVAAGIYGVDMIGHGFHVRALSWASDYKARTEMDRRELERAGVDTATVEYLDSYSEHRLHPWLSSDLRPNWVPMFSKESVWGIDWSKPASLAPGTMTYDPFEVSPTMIHSGYAALRDAVDRYAQLQHGHVWFSDPEAVVRDIWKRMVKGKFE